MATLTDNAKRAIAVIDRAVGNIREMGVDVPDGIPAEEQMDRILEIMGGEDYIMIEAHAEDSVTEKPLPKASVDISLGGGHLAAIRTDPQGVARRRWYIGKDEYETLLAAPRVKSGVKNPWYYSSTGDFNVTGSSTFIIWLRTPKTGEQMQTFGFPLYMRSGQDLIMLEHVADLTKGTYAMRFTSGNSWKQTGQLKPDTDYVFALRTDVQNSRYTCFAFTEKIEGIYAPATNTTSKHFSIGRNNLGSYPFPGIVYRADAFNSALSDSDIFRIMAGEVLSGASARFLPENITGDAWFDEDGIRSLDLRSTDHEYMERGQLEVLFSREGYADELQYVELPPYDESDGGIHIEQTMYSNDELNISPEEIHMTTAGGARTVQVASPWPVQGAVSLAGWITPVIKGNTVTVSINENVGKERRGEVVVFTGERRFRVPVTQEARDSKSYIEFEVDSSDGTFTVPFASSGAIGKNYSIDVYVNDRLYGTAAGTVAHEAGSGYKLTGLTGETANIKLVSSANPIDPSIGWARAFGFYNTAAGCNEDANKAKLLRVVNDPDYAYCSSETATGDPFRHVQYHNCVNLSSVPDESLPDSITTINSNFRNRQYQNCHSLGAPSKEYIPSGVTTVGHSFRLYQYTTCTSLRYAAKEQFPARLSNTVIGGYFRVGQYYGCSSLTVPAKEAFADNVTAIGNYFRASQYYYCKLAYVVPEVLPDTVTAIQDHFRRAQYMGCKITSTVPEVMSRNIVTIGNDFRYYQYSHCYDLPIGGHIHDHCFAEWLNDDESNYYYMFYSNTAIPIPDTVPRYYIDETHTTTAPVTDLTPAVQKKYLTNRTGIEGYTEIDDNWK